MPVAVDDAVRVPDTVEVVEIEREIDAVGEGESDDEGVAVRVFVDEKDVEAVGEEDDDGRTQMVQTGFDAMPTYWPSRHAMPAATGCHWKYGASPLSWQM